MKVLNPAFAVAIGAALLAPASLAAEQPAATEAAETDDASLVAPGSAPAMVPPALESSGRLLNPDTKCADPMVTAEGREGEGEFLREPAAPMPPPMHYAVQYKVDGCDVLIATTGELHQLPDLPDSPTLIPVQ